MTVANTFDPVANAATAASSRKPADLRMATPGPTRPSAYKHGLTASRFVSAHQAERVAANRRELLEIHTPESTEELRIVEELAIAQARVYDAEAAWDDRLRWQRVHAVELFDRGLAQRFETDMKAWRASPHGMVMVFGLTWHSSAYLRDLWNSVRKGLETGIGVTYEQIRDVVLSLGSDWRVDRIDIVRGRVMGFFLALQTDADAAVERWVEDSRAGRENLAPIEVDLDRAHEFLDAAPPREEAREKLIRLATQEFQSWSARSDQTHEAMARERAHYAEATPGHPLGDAADVRETRLIRRYLITAVNRAEKLERRLLALKKSRVVRESRTSRTTTPISQANTPQTAQIHTPAHAETSPGTSGMSTQHSFDKGDASNVRNAPRPSGPVDPATEAAESPGRPKRRPDPKIVAKSWRNQTRSGPIPAKSGQTDGGN